jgi:hypothetical protein
MNPEEARFLKRRMPTDLGDACTGATIDVNPQRDGLQVVVTNLAPRPEGTASGSTRNVIFRMSDDGPLSRFLLRGDPQWSP